MLYQTDAISGFYYYTGSTWEYLGGGIKTINGASADASGAVNLNLIATQTGTQADRIATSDPTDALIHIVTNDSDTSQNGKVYIYSDEIGDWTLTTNFIDTDTNTDNQNITGSSFDAITSELTIGIENGTAQVVNLGSLSATPTPSLAQVTAVGSSTTLSLTLGSLLPASTTNTLGTATNTWDEVHANTIFTSNISATTVTSTQLTIADYLRHEGDPDTYMLFNPDDTRFVVGGIDTIKMLPNETSIFDGGGAQDFRVETNTKTNTLFIDGSSDNIGIGTSAPASDLHIVDSFPRITLQDSDGTNVRGFIDQENSELSLTVQNDINYGTLDFKRFDGTTTTNSMRIASTGDIGIGTLSPTTKLEVAGIVSSTGVVDSSLGNPEEVIFVGTGKRLTSTPSVTISPSGELAVSTVVSTTNIRVSGTITTTSNLVVQGDTRLEGDLTTTDADIVFQDNTGSFPTSGKGFFWQLNNDKARIYARQDAPDEIDFVFYLDDNATTNTDKYIFYHRDYNGIAQSKFPLTMSGKNFYVYAPPSTTAGKPDLTSWAMRVEPNGDVDIDRDLSVGDDLTVTDDLTVADVSATNITATTVTATSLNIGSQLSFSSNATNVSPILITAPNLADLQGAFRIDANEADFILNDTGATNFSTVAFQTNGTPRCAFGRNSSDNFYITVNNGTWLDTSFVLERTTGDISMGYDLSIGGELSVTGSATVNSGIAVSSDQRLKSNVQPLKKGLESILQLQPKQYQKHQNTTKKDEGKLEYGFIAQEIQNILPELVQTTASEEKLLALSYTELIPILTKAIQEQQALITSMATKMEKMTQDKQRILDEIADLKAMVKQLVPSP